MKKYLVGIHESKTEKELPVFPCVFAMLNPNLCAPDGKCALRCSLTVNLRIWIPFKTSFGPFSTNPKHWRVNFGIWARSSFSKSGPILARLRFQVLDLAPHWASYKKLQAPLVFFFVILLWNRSSLNFFFFSI